MSQIIIFVVLVFISYLGSIQSDQSYLGQNENILDITELNKGVQGEEVQKYFQEYLKGFVNVSDFLAIGVKSYMFQTTFADINKAINSIPIDIRKDKEKVTSLFQANGLEKFVKILPKQDGIDIVEHLKDYRKNLANSYITKSLVMSAITIGIEFHALYQVYKELNNDESIIEDSKNELDEIRLKIIELNYKTEEPIKHFLEMYNKDLDKFQKQELNSNITYFLFVMSGEVRHLRESIGEIKIKTKYGIMKLETFSTDQGKKAIVNLANAGYAGFEIYKLCDIMSPWQYKLKVLEIFTHSLIAFMNGRNTYLCDETIKNCKEVLNEAKKLEHEMNIVEDNIKEAIKIINPNNK